ncbi:MAG: hypothetical protein LKJ78_08185 [Serratia liquefaciens]|jgi:hypothetical protein|uniref:hypothetical protein n=1 Tax=Serratia proteamaculans TaxID=28151 RepID=UPI0021843A85|nr:hypothetical protein [Serratia proteamaculans]MCH4196486.1 hypothetical protein [Serratia liquefaciens]MCH4230801.1 hypothetical protein [Serratia liquefaciens]MCH4262505.1 hypothetical protein [Serratia liquefaciens]MCI1214626.1 hypothetical protein [Serratia liquefaciens]MCI1235980.1 hypothetical protein [Serratia liquefaciens]
MNNVQNDIATLTQQLAAACIRHLLRESGSPALLVDSERYQVHAVVMLEQESTEVCIRKGLVDLLIGEFGKEQGEITACYMLRLSVNGGEITETGLDIINSIFLDGVESRLETGEAL